MSNREKEKVKTLHAIGNVQFKDAKKAILEVKDEKIDYSKYAQFALDPNTFNELVYIAREILEKNKDDDPEKIVSRMESHKRVKELMKKGIINDGDVRDALYTAFS
ncbi:MAG: hypothetical protein HY831_04035 [Candidatus Aenigmarchaeota archaeon]|nr:hypothetical protein [Candidatus Aenigmarchaeota archaeon]